LGLRRDGTVISWGYTNETYNSVPQGLTSVKAIASGWCHNVVLLSNGCVQSWGYNGGSTGWNVTNVPTVLSNVMAIAAGRDHSVALKNDGTVISWGDNTYGQTNIMSGITPVKAIAAGDYHTLAIHFSPSVMYPVDVSKDVLLIYNAASMDSSNVWAYYMQHRPMTAGANILAISCPVGEFTSTNDYIQTIQNPVLNWYVANPLKRPQYIILFKDIPIRFTDFTSGDDLRFLW
jgi:hypothetical protein